MGCRPGDSDRDVGDDRGNDSAEHRFRGESASLFRGAVGDSGNGCLSLVLLALLERGRASCIEFGRATLSSAGHERSAKGVGVGASRRRPWYRRPGLRAPTGGSVGPAPTTTASESRERTTFHRARVTDYCGPGSGHRRRSGLPRLYAGTYRAGSGIAVGDPHYRNDVRGSPFGFHPGSMALLCGGERNLRHRDRPYQIDSSGRGAPHLR